MSVVVCWLVVGPFEKKAILAASKIRVCEELCDKFVDEFRRLKLLLEGGKEGVFSNTHAFSHLLESHAHSYRKYRFLRGGKRTNLTQNRGCLQLYQLGGAQLGLLLGVVVAVQRALLAVAALGVAVRDEGDFVRVGGAERGHGGGRRFDRRRRRSVQAVTGLGAVV
uniref:(northern house mosquito) hypothetical protein n=1 Tax=Culex pipiens TaxID=7175 RepID=A0A8D8BP47_CULPI